MTTNSTGLYKERLARLAHLDYRFKPHFVVILIIVFMYLVSTQKAEIACLYRLSAFLFFRRKQRYYARPLSFIPLPIFGVDFSNDLGQKLHSGG